MKNNREKDKSIELFSVLTAFLLVLGICVCDHASDISGIAASLVFKGDYLNSGADEAEKISAQSIETENGTQKPSEDEKEVNSPSGKLSPAKLKEDPEDILNVIKKYTELFKNDKADNNIKSVTYGEKGATDIFDNIRIRNNTETRKPDFKAALARPLELKIDKSKPAVLIFHSHTSEGYELIERSGFPRNYEPRTNDENLNVVRVGTEITEYLEKAGYTVIHDKNIHDNDYTGSYPHSRETIDEILKKNPQIQIVIDIHRDSITLDNGDKIKPVTEINGKNAAQMMIITGTEEGDITGFPDWEYNLAFALKLQKKCEDMFPGIMRPLLFTKKKYNMDVTHFSLLIEMGSEANTLQEACYSGRLLAAALASFMDDYK